MYWGNIDRRARFRRGVARRRVRDHVSKKRYPPESRGPFTRMWPRLLLAARESEIFAMARAQSGARRMNRGGAPPSTKGRGREQANSRRSREKDRREIGSRERSRRGDRRRDQPGAEEEPALQPRRLRLFRRQPPQRPHGAQPAHRRIHQDQGEQRRSLQGGHPAARIALGVARSAIAGGRQRLRLQPREPAPSGKRRGWPEQAGQARPGRTEAAPRLKSFLRGAG